MTKHNVCFADDEKRWALIRKKLRQKHFVMHRKAIYHFFSIPTEDVCLWRHKFNRDRYAYLIPHGKVLVLIHGEDFDYGMQHKCYKKEYSLFSIAVWSVCLNWVLRVVACPCSECWSTRRKNILKFLWLCAVSFSRKSMQKQKHEALVRSKFKNNFVVKLTRFFRMKFWSPEF